MCKYSIYIYLLGVFKNIYYLFLLLYFSSKSFIDFIPNPIKIDNPNKIIQNNQSNTLQYNNTNYNKLEKELINEKSKNKKLNEQIMQLKKELDDERNKNNQLKENIKKLEKALIDERKMVPNFSKNLELQKIIDSKNKEIEDLKFKNNPLYNIKPGEKIYAIIFISVDQKIVNYAIACKNTDIFVRLEEKLYEDYPEYKDKETYFMKNANRIKRFKSLEENNIRNNDVLMLYTYDK